MHQATCLSLTHEVWCRVKRTRSHNGDLITTFPFVTRWSHHFHTFLSDQSGRVWSYLIWLCSSRPGNLADDDMTSPCQHVHQSPTRSPLRSRQANLNHHTHHAVISPNRQFQNQTQFLKFVFFTALWQGYYHEILHGSVMRSFHFYSIFPCYCYKLLWSCTQYPNSDPVSSFESNNKHWSWSGVVYWN